jgi:hypothetical protein
MEPRVRIAAPGRTEQPYREGAKVARKANCRIELPCLAGRHEDTKKSDGKMCEFFVISNPLTFHPLPSGERTG